MAKQNCSEPKPIDMRNHPKYPMGVAAAKRGVFPKKAPPGLFGDDALAWWNGYLDTRTALRLSHIFAKYRISYP